MYLKNMSKTYHITGNTYAHRDAIRKTGAAWNKTEKRWELTVRCAGMKRNDGAYYTLRKLPGLNVKEA